MKNFEIEVATRRLTGMVKVDFRDGMTMYVNVSDIVPLANHRVRVGTHRCAMSRVRSIVDGSGIYAKQKIAEDKPEQGKIYSLFGGENQPSIAAGNTWAESEVKEEL
jgi:hypothetical protein